MCIITQGEGNRIELGRFSPRHAFEIAGWVKTDLELRWLAPSTDAPLTAEKVISWKRSDGTALVATRFGSHEPIGYAELNPMRAQNAHWWLGHIVVDPRTRGAGVGRDFVRMLLAHAFDTLGAKRVSLVVFPDNRVAIRCYEGTGFSVIGEEYHRFGASKTRHRLLRLETTASDVNPSDAISGRSRGLAARVRRGFQRSGSLIGST